MKKIEDARSELYEKASNSKLKKAEKRQLESLEKFHNNLRSVNNGIYNVSMKYIYLSRETKRLAKFIPCSLNQVKEYLKSMREHLDNLGVDVKVLDESLNILDKEFWDDGQLKINESIQAIDILESRFKEIEFQLQEYVSQKIESKESCVHKITLRPGMFDEMKFFRYKNKDLPHFARYYMVVKDTKSLKELFEKWDPLMNFEIKIIKEFPIKYSITTSFK